MTIWLFIAVLWMVPLWVLLPRAGLSSWWALAAIIPVGGIILLWVMAFRRWPDDDIPGRFD
jgi:hypothetical protein